MAGYSVRLGVLGILLLLCPSAARAQAYEAIGFCKRNTGVLLACIVIEKIGDAVIEKVVEKKLQDWWAYWDDGGGRNAATPDAYQAQIVESDPSAAGIAGAGYDYRTLMQDVSDTIGSASGLDDGELVGRLGSACSTGGSPVICGEFSPLFSQIVPRSICESLVDEVSCIDSPGCAWRFGLCVTRSD